MQRGPECPECLEWLATRVLAACLWVNLDRGAGGLGTRQDTGSGESQETQGQERNRSRKEGQGKAYDKTHDQVRQGVERSYVREGLP